MSNFDPKNPDDWKALGFVLVFFGLMFLASSNIGSN